MEIVNVPGIIGTRGIELICKLWGGNRNVTFRLVSNTLVTFEKGSSKTKEAKKDIHMFCPGVLYNVTRDVVDSVYGKIFNFLQLLEMIDQNIDDIREKIIYHESIINRLKLDEKLYEGIIVPLVQHMKVVWDDPALNKLDVYWRKRYKKSIDKLSTSLRMIILSRPLCIKNSHHGDCL